MNRIRPIVTRFAAALDASPFLRRVLSLMASTLFGALVYVAPLAGNHLIALALIAMPGIAAVLSTGSYRGLPGWIAVWYVAIYSHPVLAPIAFVIGQTWMLDLTWCNARGLREIVTHQPG